MTTGAARDALAGRQLLWRILVYYLFFGLVALLVALRFPWLVDLLSVGPEFPTQEITRTFGGTPLESATVPDGWEGMLVATASLLGALAIMVPVAWSYIFIKRRTGYDQSVVHTLLILPVAVTGIVIIVKGSLALAFSLAGIVAAVRFRTTLNDTKDAVYVFLAIGVGLAAGVQALGVAVSLSVVFNAVNLVLWRLGFGNVYVDRLQRTGGMVLGDAVAGAGSETSAVAFGDTRLMEAMSPTEIRDVADRLARTERYLKAEADTRKERKQYSVLMVYTSTVGAAQALVEPILDRLAARWSLAEIAHGDASTSILEYLVRVDEGLSAGDLLDAIRHAPGDAVKAAEIRSLKGMAKRVS